MKNKGLLIVFSGPSGVGKDTILNKIIDKRKNLKLSVSYTTRKPRYGETDGVNYNFVTKEKFLEVISKNGMLEYAKYCDNYYGTPKEIVENELSKGNNVILKIEVQGGLKILKDFKDAIGIFVIPPSMDEIYNRLKNRNLDSEENISKRINELVKEVNYVSYYDYVVINDNMDNCSSDILKIIDVNLMKYNYMHSNIERILKNEKNIC